MAERRGGGAGWFIVGFLTGVLAALAVMLLADGRGRPRAEPAPTETPARATPRPAHRATPPPEPPAETAAPASEAAPALDPQVAEDAAAAGMTSRRSPP